MENLESTEGAQSVTELARSAGESRRPAITSATADGALGLYLASTVESKVTSELIAYSTGAPRGVLHLWQLTSNRW